MIPTDLKDDLIFYIFLLICELNNRFFCRGACIGAGLVSGVGGRYVCAFTSGGPETLASQHYPAPSSTEASPTGALLPPRRQKTPNMERQEARNRKVRKFFGVPRKSR